MDNLLRKSVVQKGFRNMAVLGLGLVVSVGLTPVTTWASLQNQAEQSCRFNAQSQDSDSKLTRIFSGERIILARGGNRSGGGRGGGGGMGRNGGDNSESGDRDGSGNGSGDGTRTGEGPGNSERGHRYGPGDGTGTGERPKDGAGYGAKKGGGTGDCDGTGSKGKGRGNQTN